MSEAKAAAENVWRSKGAAGAGGGKRVITILIFLLAFLLLSFLAFGYGAIKDRQDKEYITLAGEQEVLSQRLAKQALEAVGGKTEAFSQPCANASAPRSTRCATATTPSACRRCRRACPSS